MYNFITQQQREMDDSFETLRTHETERFSMQFQVTFVKHRSPTDNLFLTQFCYEKISA